MFAPSAGRAANLIPLPVRRPRLLLVTDSSESRQRLLGKIDLSRFDVTCADSLPQLQHRLRRAFDAVLVDVSAPLLPASLRAIRASDENRAQPVLVEFSAKEDDPSLAGLLPLHRAMPCNLQEMMRLLSRLADSPLPGRPTRNVL